VRRFFRRRRTRQILWIVPSHARPEDESLATQLCANLVGCPDVEHRMQPHAGFGQFIGPWKHTAAILLVGPPVQGWRESAWLRCARGVGIPIVLLLGAPVTDSRRIRLAENCASFVDALIVAHPDLQHEISGAIPRLRSIRDLDCVRQDGHWIRRIETLAGV
jgi:hypothetical protein